MKHLHSVLIFAAMLYGTLCLGQKNLQEIIEAKGITGIQINSDQIYKIDISTSKTGKITLKSGIAGENFETMRVNSVIKAGILEITASRDPFFENIDDKLAAHKVMSIVLEINIPEQLKFWVASSLAAVSMQGTYDYISLNLGRGDCRLEQFRGSGIINTRSGNIRVATQDCKIVAASRHGKEKITNVESGSHHLELKSIGGSITVIQSQ